MVVQNWRDSVHADAAAAVVAAEAATTGLAAAAAATELMNEMPREADRCWIELLCLRNAREGRARRKMPILSQFRGIQRSGV